MHQIPDVFLFLLVLWHLINFLRRQNYCVVIFLRVTQRKVNVESLLHCAPSALHSGLSVVRDPTTGMLMDFTEVGHKHTFSAAPFLCVSTNNDTCRVDTDQFRHFLGCFRLD